MEQLSENQLYTFSSDVRRRSDRLMNFFLFSYFAIGLGLAFFYGTWIIALGVGGLALLAYYSIKWMLPDSTLYQYVLSMVIGIFMAQFIFQMHGLFEMHFFAFIGSALLITYQKWRLQIPVAIFVIVHHFIFSYLQNIGYKNLYFTQLDDFDIQTFIIHISLTIALFFICGLWAYQLKKYTKLQIVQSIEMADLRKEAQLAEERRKSRDILKERNEILESIGDAFFAVDRSWNVTYWNNMAAVILRKPKKDMIGRNFWKVYADVISPQAHLQMHRVMDSNTPVQFEEHYPAFNAWYEISVYPTPNGLSVYFKEVTERYNYLSAIQDQNARLREISWIQSHIIRAPLTRIMGLIPLLNKADINNKEDLDMMLDYLSISANELDDAIKSITDKTRDSVER